MNTRPAPLQIFKVADRHVQFVTSSSAGFAWASEADVLSARGKARRYDVAYLFGNALDESDCNRLLDALKAAS